MKVYGHRGFAGIAPENTMASFRKAIEAGVDGIECDVHLSKDGRVVVCHDPTLERTTSGTGLIKDLDWCELQRLDAGSWYSQEYTGERIPSFKQLLELLSDYNISLNVELKTDKVDYVGLEHLVLELLEQHDMVGRSIISSFNFESLVKVKSLLPGITTAALYKNMEDVDDFWNTMGSIGVSKLHPRFRELTSEFVAEARQRGYVVNVWVPNEPSEIEHVIALGVDGLITNYPDRARSMLDACNCNCGSAGGGLR